MAKRRRRFKYRSDNSENPMAIKLNHDIYLALMNVDSDLDHPFNFEDYEIEEEDFATAWEDDVVTSYQSSVYLDLTKLEPERLQVLKSTLFALPAKTLVRGTKSVLTKYIAIQDGKIVRASGAKQMHMLMSNYLALNAERFWMIERECEQDYFYAVDSVEFYPEYNNHRDYRPASFSIKVNYMKDGEEKRTNFKWENGQCRGMTPEQLLRDDNLKVATLEDCEKHDLETLVYQELAVDVGRQCLSSGVGIGGQNFGSNGKNLGVNGEPSLVVVDVKNDDDEDATNSANVHKRSKHLPWQMYEIRNRKLNNTVVMEDDEDYEEEEKLYIEYPVHPIVKVFDLRRHIRYRIHINDLAVYEFDKNLADKLVIDDEVKELIALLAQSKSVGFKDVVAGKSGGTTVLLAGPPGVGKTLTAEIYSEAVEKPLYRVQCSQLGTNPDTLEEQLLEVFRRANRWGAIILLDESDVYVSKRGESLTKNAIVGVFLRVLEYQENVLFLTTNLPESVDDAIASRCIARIDYVTPTEQQGNEIWDILAANSDMELTWATRMEVVNEFPFLSGRDIKNILKLINVRNQEITIESVRKAAKFHPNRGNWNEQGHVNDLTEQTS